VTQDRASGYVCASLSLVGQPTPIRPSTSAKNMRCRRLLPVRNRRDRLSVNGLDELVVDGRSEGVGRSPGPRHPSARPGSGRRRSARRPTARRGHEPRSALRSSWLALLWHGVTPAGRPPVRHSRPTELIVGDARTCCESWAKLRSSPPEFHGEVICSRSTAAVADRAIPGLELASYTAARGR
jgi:hypothetical protein